MPISATDGRLAAALALVALALPGAGRTGPLDDVFAAQDVTATMVVIGLHDGSEYIHNHERAGQRFAPASTFKIPNTLIALDTGAVDAAETRFEWDGRDRGVSTWNQDHSLASAFRASCVWCYRSIARDVGRQAYIDALRRLDYGNRQIGARIDNFWLDGSLRISAREQVAFLARLARRELPYAAGQLAVLEEIMLVESNDSGILYGKSGWALTEPQVAWFVGYVRRDSATWVFALNIEIAHEAQAGLRRSLARDALAALGIFR